MTKYAIKLNSLGDIVKFKKICSKYDIAGYIKQKNFQTNLKHSTLPLLLSIPLDEAELCVESSRIQNAEKLETLIAGWKR
ncbi:MAG: hypothetical protein J6C33_11180 [Lachnospiraceae bacterium]|nr:hypothetical protein [Lachnospiraceae bacterium]